MTDTCSDTNEEQALNAALEEATPILAQSLQRAERTRRRKRRLIAGGLMMLVLGASIVAALVLVTGEPGGSDDSGIKLNQLETRAEAERLEQEGWALWFSGKNEEAAQHFTAAIKLEPESANLRHGLGWSYYNAKQHDKAADAFEEALKLDGAHPGAINGMGQIAYTKRDYQRAKVWLLQAPDGPTGNVAQQTLVSVYLLLGEYEQAEALSAKLLKGVPIGMEDGSTTTGRAWVNVLHAAADAGELTDELRRKIEPVAQNSGGPVAAQELSQKGWALWGEQKWREAESAFLEALELDPELANAHNGLGWALITQGQPARAQKHLERCIELEPGHGGAINGLGLSLKNQGEIDRAIEVWEDLYRQSPQPHAGAVNLARTYVEQGRFENAIPLLEQIILAHPGPSEYKQLLDKARSAGGVGEKDGVNLLDNGGFERGTLGWIIGSNSGRMKLEPDQTDKTEGKQSLRITKTGGMPIDIVRINIEGLIPGQAVDVSAKIKTDNAANAWMKFYVWDTHGEVLVRNLDVARIHGTHGWRTVKKRYAIPQDTENAAIQFWMVMGGTVWIDDVRVEPVDSGQE